MFPKYLEDINTILQKFWFYILLQCLDEICFKMVQTPLQGRPRYLGHFHTPKKAQFSITIHLKIKKLVSSIVERVWMYSQFGRPARQLVRSGERHAKCTKWC